MTDSAYLEIAYSSIRVFADDGSLDLGELNYLLGLAMRDGMLDDDEKRVLGNVFAQAVGAGLSPRVRARMDEIRRRHGF